MIVTTPTAPTLDPQTQWLSPAQAGRALGVTGEWARKLAQAGRLQGVETPLGWLIDAADVERLARERAAAGEQSAA